MNFDQIGLFDEVDDIIKKSYNDELLDRAIEEEDRLEPRELFIIGGSCYHNMLDERMVISEKDNEIKELKAEIARLKKVDDKIFQEVLEVLDENKGGIKVCISKELYIRYLKVLNIRINRGIKRNLYTSNDFSTDVVNNVLKIAIKNLE